MSAAGAVAELWRFPVKSLRGEQLQRAVLTTEGIPGDRGLGLRDPHSGNVFSARRLPELLQFHASGEPGAVLITLPDGTTTRPQDPDVDQRLSAALGREVTLDAPQPHEIAQVELLGDGLSLEGDVDVFTSRRPGTFFDTFPIHIVTDATLARLNQLAPDSVFDRRRFRANLVVATGAEPGFVEDGWVGREVRVGDAVLAIRKACTRCVMTTLEQDELTRDRDILRTAIAHNDQHVGVYADVVAEGAVTVGDAVALLD